MNSKMPNVITTLLIVVVLMAIAWVTGKRHGASQAMAIAEKQLSSQEAQIMIDGLQLTVFELREELAAANLRAETHAARAEALSDELVEQMNSSLENANDLALYRRIEASENPRSVDVAALDWDPLQPDLLALTLVQWSGRGRVKGEVLVSLIYPRAAGAVSGQLPADNESKPQAQRVQLEPATFDFRFFQNISLSTMSQSRLRTPAVSGDGAPQAVEITVQPTDSRLKSFKFVIPWSDITE